MTVSNANGKSSHTLTTYERVQRLVCSVQTNKNKTRISHIGDQFDLKRHLLEQVQLAYSLLPAVARGKGVRVIFNLA